MIYQLHLITSITIKSMFINYIEIIEQILILLLPSEVSSNRGGCILIIHCLA